MIFNQIRKCNSSQEYKIEHNYNVFRTENSTILKGNIIFLIPFDDTLFVCIYKLYNVIQNECKLLKTFWLTKNCVMHKIIQQ